MKVTLTDFVDFVIASGSPKLTRVRQAKQRREEEYNPATDYWKPLRDRIVQFHRTGETDRKSLKDVVTRVSTKKRDRYLACLEGYTKFLGNKRFEWFSPPRSVWGPGDLEISVNPELGLVRGDERGVIKLYFKSDKLSKRRVDVILLLLREALRGRVGAESYVGILDVPRAKLYASTAPDRSLLPLLEGEAESFARIWERI